MQKTINLLAVISFLLSAGMSTLAISVVLNAPKMKDEAIQRIRAEVVLLVLDATSKQMQGMMPTETGPALPFSAQ
jgi:hypothetical protein|tara:strand:+ start:556 stop:780 length:225 start_codon:yes stop_codon:yes gene_type:complete